jgi:glycosyltransferase involved in cell wall biosynthesis
VPNIIDLDQFPFHARIPLKPRLLCPRNLEPIYNVSCVIRAFPRVKAAWPGAVMAIAGDGSERPKLEALCKDLGVAGSVRFLGQVPHSHMPGIYRDYDILVNSSDVDNVPGVILEAFAAGLPVVSSNTGGIPYLVKPGQTGLLFPRNDDRALAEAVLGLLDDPSLVERITTAARDYSRTCSVDSVLRAMDRVISRLNSSGPIDAIA